MVLLCKLFTGMLNDYSLVLPLNIYKDIQCLLSDVLGIAIASSSVRPNRLKILNERVFLEPAV